MKTYPPEADEDYEGNKGCLIMIIASCATFGIMAALSLIILLIINLIKLIS